MDKKESRIRLGQHLRKLREQRGLSQDKLGELSGLTRKDLIAIEKAHINYGIDKLLLIFSVLKPSKEDIKALFDI